MISVYRYRMLLESEFSFVVRTKVISSYRFIAKMRPRASWRKLDCIFVLSKWIIFFTCLLSLMPNGIIAQNKTFEDFFGLDSRESTASYNAEENIGLLPHEKEAEALTELEDLAVEEKDLTSIEKKDEEKNPIEILPEIKNVFALKNDSEKVTVSPFVQVISGKMADEKNGKYVRYGK